MDPKTLAEVVSKGVKGALVEWRDAWRKVHGKRFTVGDPVGDRLRLDLEEAEEKLVALIDSWDGGTRGSKRGM